MMGAIHACVGMRGGGCTSTADCVAKLAAPLRTTSSIHTMTTNKSSKWPETPRPTKEQPAAPSTGHSSSAGFLTDAPLLRWPNNLTVARPPLTAQVCWADPTNSEGGSNVCNSGRNPPTRQGHPIPGPLAHLDGSNTAGDGGTTTAADAEAGHHWHGHTPETHTAHGHGAAGSDAHGARDAGGGHHPWEIDSRTVRVLSKQIAQQSKAGAERLSMVWSV